ncbi:MAG: hypothetical protein WCL51_18280 [Bacteroidota bacterium]
MDKKYILKMLCEFERELVVGDEKNNAPRTLARIRKLSENLAEDINREEEKRMIANALKKNSEV